MIYLDQSLKLIQQIRVLHAIAESGLPIYISENEAYKLEPLQKYFNIHFNTGTCNGVKFSQLIKIDHSKPTTSIGEIERTLIFPHAITKYLRLMWQSKRKYKYSFAGLVTSERKSVIENWLKNIINERKIQLPKEASLINRLIRKVFPLWKVERIAIRQYGYFNIWSSTRGRVFPIKSWDEDYFNFLAHSEFVLCPSGKYTWSYRFFETILCGAIPIVEEYCDAYNGFKFKYMEDKLDELVWNKDVIEYNYNLCLERITIPQETMAFEVTKFKSS